MSASVIDHDHFVVTRSLHIDAPPARVWDAVTRPEHISRWFGQTASFDSFEVGALGSFGWTDYGDSPVRIERIDEPFLFEFSWGTSGEDFLPSNSTLVTFTLVEEGDGTLLTVHESGFEGLPDPAASLEDHRGGWDAELDELDAYLSA